MVDKDTQMLYWYNIRDQSSQWMSDEDQTAYQAHEIIEAPSDAKKSKRNLKAVANGDDVNIPKKTSMLDFYS